MKLQKKPRGKFGFAIRFWRFPSGAAHFGNVGCGKLRRSHCAIDAFMSTIKMFPMAMLPGWPFAPSSTPGAWFVQRQFEPRPFEHDSLNIYSLNIVVK